MTYMNTKNIQLDIDGWNRKIDELKNSGISFVYVGNRTGMENTPLYPTIAYIEKQNKGLKVKLWIKEANKRVCYIAKEDGSIDYTCSGAEASRCLSKYYKVPDLSPESWEQKNLSSSAMIEFNPMRNKQANYAYGYDINGAYASILCSHPYNFIDLNNPQGKGVIQQGQIGFLIAPTDEEEFFPNYKNDLILVENGWADYRFNLVYEPQLEKFARYYYKLKKNATTAAEKQKYKSIVNSAIGNWQNHNVFARAFVVGMCNLKIQKFIEQLGNNALSWNTDSVVSLVPIREIEENLGDEIGQWKIEHIGIFLQKGCNYQWLDDELGNNKTSIRGVVKDNIPYNWNLLHDPLPIRGINRYKLNTTTFKLEENDEWVKYMGMR